MDHTPSIRNNPLQIYRLFGTPNLRHPFCYLQRSYLPLYCSAVTLL